MDPAILRNMDQAVLDQNTKLDPVTIAIKNLAQLDAHTFAKLDHAAVAQLDHAAVAQLVRHGVREQVSVCVLIVWALHVGDLS